ncbi:MAG: hypothetical protein ACRD8U_08685 [Pyrinomonadaceae bacterium]
MKKTILPFLIMLLAIPAAPQTNTLQSGTVAFGFCSPWIVYQVILSSFHSLSELVMHALLLVVAYSLSTKGIGVFWRHTSGRQIEGHKLAYLMRLADPRFTQSDYLQLKPRKGIMKVD